MQYTPYEMEEIQNLRVRDLQRQAEEIRRFDSRIDSNGSKNGNRGLRKIVHRLLYNLFGRKNHSSDEEQPASLRISCRSDSAYEPGRCGC